MEASQISPPFSMPFDPDYPYGKPPQKYLNLDVRPGDLVQRSDTGQICRNKFPRRMLHTYPGNIECVHISGKSDDVSHQPSTSGFDLMQPGKLLKARWNVLKKIGMGGFGQIYAAYDFVTREHVAIKAESTKGRKPVLAIEAKIISKLSGKENITRIFGYGRTVNISYVVMELLGPNLDQLRKAQPSKKFSTATTLRVALQIVNAIETLHTIGYIHRDIKPSNLAIGLQGNRRRVYMIDFGLAIKYTTASGEVRQPRSNVTFCGTTNYASLNTHHNKDFGRRDDLWSLVYSIVEFSNGRLPWSGVRNDKEVASLKSSCSCRLYLKQLPFRFGAFVKHIKSLKYADRPNYGLLRSIISECIEETNTFEANPYDWEEV